MKDRAELYSALPKGGAVIEIGVQHGDNAAEILRHSAPSKLTLVDCWQRQEDGVYALDPTNTEALPDVYEKVKGRFASDRSVGASSSSTSHRDCHTSAESWRRQGLLQVVRDI
jgi:hypothetical protein